MHPNYDHAELIVSSSIASPAVRAFALLVWVEDDDIDGEPEFDIHPAIAVESRTIENYSRRTPQGEDRDVLLMETRETLLKKGFVPTSRETKLGFIIDTPDHGLISTLDDDLRTINSRVIHVVCPWSENQDAEKFKQRVDEAARSIRRGLAELAERETAK